MKSSAEKRDFYQKLRGRIQRWIEETGGSHRYAEVVMLAPDLFHLMVKLSMDPKVPRKHKTQLALAIAYFISPIDVVPEAVLGPVGYVDDVALAAYVLNQLISQTDPSVVRRHWAGEEDLLEVLEKTLGMVDDMIGSGLWEAVKSRISRR